MSESPKSRSVGGDLVIPVCAVAFTLYYFSTIIDSPWTAQISAFFIGAILIFLSLVFVAVTSRQVLKGESDLRFRSLVSPLRLIPKRLILLALTVLYIIAIEWAGFTLTSFVFLLASMMVLGDGRNFRIAAPLSALLSLSGYALFIFAFETRFPEGPFETFMKGLF